jgi:C4-type Zn-finger protein
MKAYLKAKIEKLEANSDINNIRDLYRSINDFKKRYQPRTLIVKDEKGDSIADSHSIRRGGGTPRYCTWG